MKKLTQRNEIVTLWWWWGTTSARMVRKRVWGGDIYLSRGLNDEKRVVTRKSERKAFQEEGMGTRALSLEWAGHFKGLKTRLCWCDCVMNEGKSSRKWNWREAPGRCALWAPPKRGIKGPSLGSRLLSGKRGAGWQIFWPWLQDGHLPQKVGSPEPEEPWMSACVAPALSMPQSPSGY